VADWRLQLVLKGNYINGSFEKPEHVDGYVNCINPGERTDVIGKFPFSTQSVDDAFTSAREALPRWSQYSINERTTAVSNFAEVLKIHQQASVQLIARDSGKPIWEAEHEVQATLHFMEVLLDDGLEALAPRVLEGKEGRTVYAPRGVVGLLCPHTPSLYTISVQTAAAILAGNTVVYKPSKYTPAIGQHVAELWDRCRLPRGVVNMVQGSGAIVGQHIANHKELNALVFTGNFTGATALRKVFFRRPEVAVVYQTGGKGIAIVLNDADLEQAVYEVMVGAFLTSGMRHNSTGRVIVEGEIYDQFVANLVDRSGRIAIGHPEEVGVFMGPMISDGHRNRCRKYLSLLESEGHIPLLVGGRFEIEGQKGFYCAPSITFIDHKRLNPCLNEPPQGPTLLVYRVDNADEAIELHNRAVYRHTCSIFSKSRGPFGLENRLMSGGINFNRATIGASRRLPSMGLGRASGHKQGGLGLLRSLTFPKAVLRETRPFDSTMAIPGTNWSDSDIGDSLGADTEIEDPTVLNMNLAESLDW